MGNCIRVYVFFIIGIRPQEVFFLLPLFLLGLSKLSERQRWYAIILFVSSFLLWFIPLITISGGLNNYFIISKEFAEKGALPQLQLIRNSNDYLLLIKGMYLSFGIASLSLLYYLHLFIKNYNVIVLNHYLKNNLFIFFVFWILPSLLFTIFSRSDHAGHQMTYLSAILFLISFATWKVFHSKQYFSAVLSMIVIINLVNFFRDRDPEF